MRTTSVLAGVVLCGLPQNVQTPTLTASIPAQITTRSWRLIGTGIGRWLAGIALRGRVVTASARGRIMESAQAFEPIQDGRIYIEKINGPFLFGDAIKILLAACLIPARRAARLGEPHLTARLGHREIGKRLLDCGVDVVQGGGQRW